MDWTGLARARLAKRSPRYGTDVKTPAGPLLGRNPFTRLFLAQTISRWGDTFNFVALVITVHRLTGSGLKVAATVAFEIVPVLLLGFVAGVVVDRLPRAKVMVAADFGRAAVAGALALFPDNLVVIYAAAFLLSALSVFFNPAAASVVPSLVAPAALVRANSALWSAAVISQIAMAPLAGAVVSFGGPSTAFAFNALTFVVSAGFLVRLPISRAEPVRGRSWHDVTEGLRLVRTTRFLAVLTLVQFLAALSAGATSALLVVLARDRLDLDAARFGWLLSAIGIGAALGPLVLQRLVQEVRRPLLLFGPYIVRGLVDVALATVRSFAPALAALSVYGIGTSVGMVTYNTTLQKNVDDRLRGRVFAFFDMVWQSGRLLSIALGGALADAVGVEVVYLLGGALLLLAGAAGFALVRSPHLLTEP
jgi:MFS family permease